MHNTSATPAVADGHGSKIERVITINRPVEEVYAFWRQLENLAKFMRHVESVTQTDRLHSHWAVSSPRCKLMHWDAEIIEDKPNEMISWKSLPGADVDNAGSVWFKPSGTGTEVKIAMKYDPPAGKIGAALAKLFGADVDAQLEEDLLRLKTLLETGQVPPKA